MILVLLLITIVGSVLVTWLLPMQMKSQPPYGLAVDIGVGTIAAVGWALAAYFWLSPIIGLSGWLRLAMSSLDAVGLAAVMLWVLRRIKR